LKHVIERKHSGPQLHLPVETYPSISSPSAAKASARSTNFRRT
jgi:hypothetical protein